MKEILVVDDDKDIGEIIIEYLSQTNKYNLTFTASGEDALELLRNRHFDLLITDLLIPDLNGIELTEFAYENLPKMKVLACSGGGNSGAFVAGMALDQALDEGAHSAIMKPFSEEELLSKVKSLLD